MSNDVVLQATGVSKTFRGTGSDIEVLKGEDLTVRRGEGVGIVGASGVSATVAISTTTMRVATQSDVGVDRRLQLPTNHSAQTNTKNRFVTCPSSCQPYPRLSWQAPQAFFMSCS